MKRFHVILHPTDFSDGSHAAFQYACDLARDYDVRLAVLNVVPPVSSMVGEGIMVPYDQPDVEEAVQKQLDDLRVTGPEVRLEKILRHGPVAATILESALDLRADLIVMGTHGRTGMGRLILGSVAEEVLRKAPCPVLTVKADVLS